MTNAFWQLRDPSFHILLFLLISTVVLECLVAIWAAETRRHWFVGALAVWGAVMVLVPIRAHEPVWLLAFSSPLIVATLRLIRRRQNRLEPVRQGAAEQDISTDRFRFSIRDLLMLMLLSAISLAGLIPVVRQYQPTDWLGWLVSVVTVASVAVLSQIIVTGPRRWLAGLLLLVVLPAAASGVRLATGDWTRGVGWHLGVSQSPDMLIGDIVMLTFSGLYLAAVLIVLFVLAQAGALGRSPSRRAICRTAFAAALLTLMVAVGFSCMGDCSGRLRRCGNSWPRRTASTGSWRSPSE
jgi:hypothetical protein